MRKKEKLVQIERVTISADGASSGNPGPAAIGATIKDKQGKLVARISRDIGIATNNQAEYQAIIFALKKVRLLFGKKPAKKMEIELFSDSELIINQLNRRYKIKEEDLQSLFIKVWNLTLDFKQVIFKHIVRVKNKEADYLVNQALDEQEKTSVLPGL